MAHRPAVLPVPAFVLRAVIGEFASDILASDRMLPTVLTDAGFAFEHPDIESAARWTLGH